VNKKIFNQAAAKKNNMSENGWILTHKNKIVGYFSPIYAAMESKKTI